jgi:N-acetylmuramoyl-L-alanine amidase
MKIFITAITMVLAVVTSVQAADAKGLFTSEEKPEMWCLAQNIYYEARSSNRADRMAVADVVMNRVKNTYYPNTICEVVKQGKQKPSWKDETVMVMVRNACQFSWYCDGKADDPQDMDAWVEAQQIAYNMLVHSDARGITEGATHYHAKYVSPEWARDFALVGRIGEHIFYRWE